MRISVVHNPRAGYGAVSREQLDSILRRHGYQPRYLDSDTLDERCAQGTCEMVVVAGGDGTVATVAKRLDGKGVPMAVLPAGTANNIALSLGVHKPGREADVDELVRGWRMSPRRSLDIGVAEGPWGTERFIESVGLGLFAEVMPGLTRERESGASSFESAHDDVRAARKSLAAKLCDAEMREYQIRMDDFDHSGRYALVEVMNIRSLGPNLVFSAGARPDDGRLELVLVNADQRSEVADALAGGTSLDEPLRGATVVRGASVAIDAAESFVHLDDDTDWRRHLQPTRIRIAVRAGAVGIVGGS